MDKFTAQRTIADEYEKIVFWSDEDQCFIGECPELAYGGVHGEDPVKVFKELLEVVDGMSRNI